MLFEILLAAVVSQITDTQTSNNVVQNFTEGVIETGAIQESEKERIDIRTLHFLLYFEVLR